MSDQRPPLFSVLDLVPVCRGQNTGAALQNAAALAQVAEQSGYHRYWVAEHHGIAGVASAATAVVLGFVGSATRTIRIGAGGIMLPNHSPLVVAEQFGTLEALYPGRVDLGLGRAPGGDRATLHALRRSAASADSFEQDVLELQAYLGEPSAGQPVHAVPGQGAHVPIYLLGSSLFGARLAAEMGLPFAFASHFAPDYLQQAVKLYRGQFRPSAALQKPHVMVGLNVVAAHSDEEAAYLFTTLQQSFLNLVRGHRHEVQPPVQPDALDWNPAEAAHVGRMLRISAVGGPASLKSQLEAILHLSGADELVATASLFDHEARLRSFRIGAEVMRSLG